MRSFVAIEIPSDIKLAIDRVISNVAGNAQGIRWVPTSNIHLTLKFLGDVHDDLIPEIVKRLNSVGIRYHPFSIGIRGAGAFPNFRSPNVLWLGVEASDRLAILFSEIDNVFAEIGFKKEERKFSPHLTIGRVKDRRDITSVMRELATYKDVIFGTIQVREFLLMKSVLKQSGAEYSKTAVFELNTT